MHSTHRLGAGDVLPMYIVINLVSLLPEFHYPVPLHLHFFFSLSDTRDWYRDGRGEEKKLWLDGTGRSECECEE